MSLPAEACSGQMTPPYPNNSVVVKEGRYPVGCFDVSPTAKIDLSVLAEVDITTGSPYGIKDKTGQSRATVEKTFYKGKPAMHIKGFPVEEDNPSINRGSAEVQGDPNPLVDGFSIPLPADGRFQGATHVEVWLSGKGTIIQELYDQDDPTNPNQCKWDTGKPEPKDCVVGGNGKMPANYWLPTTGDQWEVKLHLPDKEAKSGQWKRYLIPFDKFIDWNRKREIEPSDHRFIPLVTQNIGNGQVDLRPGEEAILQFTAVGKNYKTPVDIYIGGKVRFVRLSQKGH